MGWIEMGGIQTVLLLAPFETHGNLSPKVSLIFLHTQNGWWVEGIGFYFGIMHELILLSLSSLILGFLDYLINNLVL